MEKEIIDFLDKLVNRLNEGETITKDSFIGVDAIFLLKKLKLSQKSSTGNSDTWPPEI